MGGIKDDSDIDTNGQVLIRGLSIHNSQDEDWFRFELEHDGVRGQFVGLISDHEQGQLELTLFDARQLEAIKPLNELTSAEIAATSPLDVATGLDEQRLSLAGTSRRDLLCPSPRGQQPELCPRPECPRQTRGG